MVATNGAPASLPKRGETPCTPEYIFPASSFVDHNALYIHAKQIIVASNSHQEIIYTGAPSWAGAALDKLDEDLESRGIRKNYNSGTKIIWLRTMPTEIHDCHQNWVKVCRDDWIDAGLLTRAERDLLNQNVGTTIKFRGSPYAGSRKEPDFFLRPDKQQNPTFVIESGWSESLGRLRDDMNLWLVGSNGETNIVFILKWQTVRGTTSVRGELEVYALDRNRMPVLRQTEVIFPAPPPAQAQTQQIALTRREIFGQKMLPGRNANDVFNLRLDALRTVARDSLALMGLVPA